MFANNMHNAVASEKADEALDILQIAATYLSQQNKGDLCAKRPNYDFSVRFSASYVYCSVVTVGISILESHKRYLLYYVSILGILIGTQVHRS